MMKETQKNGKKRGLFDYTYPDNRTFSIVPDDYDDNLPSSIRKFVLSLDDKISVEFVTKSCYRKMISGEGTKITIELNNSNTSRRFKSPEYSRVLLVRNLEYSVYAYMKNNQLTELFNWALTH